MRLTPDTPREVLEAARSYCLRLIKLTYGYDYRADWHADLDGLLEMRTSPYAPEQRGAFYILKNEAGEIVASAGLRALTTRPDILAMAGSRYPTPETVASHWRMYVDPAYRKQGLGKTLMAMRREQALQYGYDTVYFHCSAGAKKLRDYWERNGFTCFAEDTETAHYDGALTQGATAHG